MDKIRFLQLSEWVACGLSLIEAMSAATEEKAETPTEEASVTDDTAGSHADPPEKPPEEKVKVKGVVNWFNVAKGFGASSWLFLASRMLVGRHPAVAPRKEASIRCERFPRTPFPSPVVSPDRRCGARSSARLETRTPVPRRPPSPARFLCTHMHHYAEPLSRARVSALGRRGF